jgi:hypothetical protein
MTLAPRLYITFLCLVAGHLFATNWFVSTNGTGDGSLGSPWSLQYALTNASTTNGDVIWIRGGTYFPPSTFPDYEVNRQGWKITAHGISNSPVVFRSYMNEWAAIDRPWQASSASYVKFQDLEFYDSLKGHNLTNTEYPLGPWVHWRGGNSTGQEFVNCVVHDIGNGWGHDQSSIRGCICWYVGWTALEHVTYPAPLEFSGNISGWHREAVINGARGLVTSNIMFGAGASFSGTGLPGADDILPWSEPPAPLTFTFNYCYNHFTNYSYGAAFNGASILGQPLVVTNNIFVANIPSNFSASTNGNVTFTGNTLDSPESFYPVLAVPDSSSNSVSDTNVWVFDYNGYYSGSSVSFSTNHTSISFSQWQALFGDVHSTASTGLPPDSIHVMPNLDQPKRCHIAIYNFSKANNVSVSLSGVLNSGDQYILYSAQNYLAGPIQTGTYNGSSISVPMTNLTVAPILYGTNINPSGESIVQPPLTSPEFGAFVLIGSPGAAISTLNVGTARIGNARMAP